MSDDFESAAQHSVLRTRMCPFGKNDGPAIFSGAPDGWESPHFRAFFPGLPAAGRDDRLQAAGRKKRNFLSKWRGIAR
jgi:hypothetical protein